MPGFRRPCILLAGVLAASAVGCTHNLGSFTLVATKNVDLTNFTTSQGEAQQPVSGHDSKFGSYASIEEAVDHAVEPVGAKALTNARLSVGEVLWWTWADAKGNASHLK